MAGLKLAPTWKVQNHAYFPMPAFGPDKAGYLYGFFAHRRLVDIKWPGLNYPSIGVKQARIRPLIAYVSVDGLTSNHDGRDICWAMGHDGVTIMPQHRLEWDADAGRWSGILLFPEGGRRREYEGVDGTTDEDEADLPDAYVYYASDSRFGAETDCSKPLEEVLQGFDFFILPEFTELTGQLRDRSGMGRNAIVQKLTPDHIVEGPGRGFPAAIRINAGQTLQRVGVVPGPPCRPGNDDVLEQQAWDWDDQCEFFQVGTYLMPRGFYTPPPSNASNNPIPIIFYHFHPNQRGGWGHWFGFNSRANRPYNLRVRAQDGTGNLNDPSNRDMDQQPWLMVELGYRRTSMNHRSLVSTDIGVEDTSFFGRPNRDEVLIPEDRIWLGAKPDNGYDHLYEDPDVFAYRTEIDLVFIARFMQEAADEDNSHRAFWNFQWQIHDPDGTSIAGPEEDVPELQLEQINQAPYELENSAIPQQYQTNNNVFYQESSEPLGVGNLGWYENNYPGVADQCQGGADPFFPECWVDGIGNEQGSTFAPSSEFLEKYQDPEYYSVPQPIIDNCCAMFLRCTGDRGSETCIDPSEMIFVQYLWSNYPENGIIEEIDLGSQNQELIIWCDKCNTDGFLNTVPTVYPPVLEEDLP